MALLILTMIGVIAWADAEVWPGVSLAFGYAVPIALGAYIFGLRVGVQLSLLGVILRAVCAGRIYGPWWLYAGSALMFAEYLLLALGMGLLGRAARRLRRHTRVQRHLIEFARGLTGTLDPDTLLRQSVEASVRLSGAEGGFAAAASDEGWRTDAIFRAGRWQTQPLTWWPSGAAPWEQSRTASPWQLCDVIVTAELALRELGARRALAVPIPDAGPRPHRAVVVFRAERRRFTQPTQEVLELLGLHVAAALQTATLYRTAVQATADKGRLLAHLAHELSVPLHVVMDRLEQLAPHVDDVGRPGLEQLQRQERLMLEMTSNLLEYARLEAGRGGVRRAPVDLQSLYAEIRDLAEPLIGNKAVTVAVRVDPGAEWVESDREKLRRILANLALNAVKYTPAGRVELSAVRENGAVRLAVRDTGPGIPLHEQPRLFEPFYRGGDGVAPGAGVGPGLALAQELAHLLGTEVVVESRPHAGTTFSLVLPGKGPTSLTVRPERGDGGR
jgi:signal transduction histidine kinase